MHTEIPPLPCFLNGSYTTLAEAKVSVLDRGFIFGDGVYEVVPVYQGHPFRFDHHMARLSRSLAELHIPNPHTTQDWHTIATTLCQRHAQALGGAQAQQMVYFQVTRGVAMRDHAMVPGLTPTVFAMVNTLRTPSPQSLTEGVRCVSADDFRWTKAHIKATSLLGAVLARQISVEAEATETIMFRGDELSEASSSNVWVVKNGQVAGPPRDHRVLEGIRYGLMAELCAQAGIPFTLRPIGRGEVFAADELLLSSASKEILPVSQLDEHPIGTGRPGPIFQQLYQGYQQAKLNPESHS